LKLSFKSQLLLAFASFGLLVLIFSNILVYAFTQDAHSKKIIQKIESKFNERENFFFSEIDRYETFLFSIIHSKVFQSKVAMSDLKGISNILKARLNGERDVFRLRFIDNEGQELSSIRRIGHSVKSFPLQDKSHRYYFKDTKDLKNGEVWFSKIDLNKDFGKIEKPIKPTLRIISPLYLHGQKEGILVANISMDSILKSLAKTSLFNVYLVDKDGEFIWFNDGKNDYSFAKYLNKSYNLNSHFPNNYMNILSNNQFLGDNFYSAKLDFDNSEDIKMILSVKDSVLSSNSSDFFYIILKCLIVTTVIGILFMYFIINRVDKVKKEHESEILAINRNLQDSIGVASLIQSSILPNNKIFDELFDEYFVYYQPKDVVSGDIYLVRKISQYESLVMLIDCTGHGVSGAFITMLVRAIEKDLLDLMHYGKTSIDIHHKISTAEVLSIFNERIKELLRQNNKESVTKSDFGFDGGVLYVNKKTNIATYSGANMPLFIVQNDKLKMLKPDRHSIGYKKSDINYKFNEYYIDLTNKQTVYLTTDGYIDQLGGEKGFPFARKRFMKIVENNYHKPLDAQKEIFIDEINAYQKDYENVDDRTLIALRF
jgi:serine phosphatase RsbU (regulator of sigma subunit)